MGKLIGVLVGFLLFRQFGALIGLLIGHFFDRGLHYNIYQIPRERAATIQRTFFTATFSVMGHIAKADGRISEDEIRAARRVMSRLELTESQKQDAIRLFGMGKQPDFNLEQMLLTLRRECQHHRDLLRFFIEIQLEAALADGYLHPEEQRLLLIMCQTFRYSPQEFEQLRFRRQAEEEFHYHHRRSSGNPRHSLTQAYNILGVQSSDSPAIIKKAYRKLMNQHHPDKLVAKGLPEGMIKLAKEKTQQISAAYDMVREARGFR